MRIKETIAWAASVCLVGAAVWYSTNGFVLKPSYALEIDNSIDELLARS